MTKETKRAMLENVISLLLDADIKFFVEVMHSYYQIDAYGENIEKVLSMNLGFEKEKISDGKNFRAVLKIPLIKTEQATTGAFN